MKKWIIMAVDTGPSSDKKARFLGLCQTEEEAKAFVRNDMEAYADARAGEDMTVDFDKMSIKGKSFGCEWNAEWVET